MALWRLWQRLWRLCREGYVDAMAALPRFPCHPPPAISRLSASSVTSTSLPLPHTEPRYIHINTGRPSSRVERSRHGISDAVQQPELVYSHRLITVEIIRAHSFKIFSPLFSRGDIPYIVSKQLFIPYSSFHCTYLRLTLYAVGTCITTYLILKIFDEY